MTPLRETSAFPARPISKTTYIEHPAVTHEETVSGSWWNWSPNKEQGPFEGPPSFPADARGTWQGPHTDGGPSQDQTGTFSQGVGHGSWFHREQSSVKPVVDKEARIESVITDYPKVTCPEPTEELTQLPAVVLSVVTPPAVVPPVVTLSAAQPAPVVTAAPSFTG